MASSRNGKVPKLLKNSAKVSLAIKSGLFDTFVNRALRVVLIFFVEKIGKRWEAEQLGNPSIERPDVNGHD